MRYFIVVLSDVAAPLPSGHSFDHVGFRPCAQFPRRPSTITPAELTCDHQAIGQFLYAYVETQGVFAMCEMEIYGER